GGGGLVALAPCALAMPGMDQEKKDNKKNDKKTETKKDDTKKVDTKKDDKKDTKKDDKKKEEKKDERIYPPVEPVLEIKGHTDWVNRVAFTPDGQHLVTASRDKSLRIWEVGSGKEVLKVKDLPAGATALALSPDGGKLATTAGKWLKDKQQWVGEVNLYDAKTGKLVSTIKGHADPIEAVAFHPKGTQLATASNDGTAKVWDVAGGKELFTLKGHGGPVVAIAYSGDGKWIATGSDDKTVKLWDASDGKEVRTLKGPSRRVSAVAFSKDDKYLAAGSQDGTVTVWEAATGKEVRVLNADEGVLAVAFSPDRTRLAARGRANGVQLRDVSPRYVLNGLDCYNH